MDVFFWFVLAFLSFLTQILLIELSGFLPPPVFCFISTTFSQSAQTERQRGWTEAGFMAPAVLLLLISIAVMWMKFFRGAPRYLISIQNFLWIPSYVHNLGIYCFQLFSITYPFKLDFISLSHIFWALSVEILREITRQRVFIELQFIKRVVKSYDRPANLLIYLFSTDLSLKKTKTEP